MTPHSVTTTVDLTGTESIQFSVLATRFKLSEAELAAELIRYGLSLSGHSIPANASSIRDFLDRQINVQEAVADQIRGAMDRLDEGVRAHTIVAGLLASRLAELPHSKPTA
jgi:hypothetical protein